jgi:thiol-disulfide isomerase/thioredoxin
MRSFSKAFKAEQVKIRRTGIYYMGIVLGAITPIIGFIVSFNQAPQDMESSFPLRYYEKFSGDYIVAFTNFFFPLAIIIAVTRVAQLDHRNGGWQLMETQPVSKFSVYFSKFLVILVHNLLSIVTYVLLGLLLSWIATFFQEVPKGMIMQLPWGYFGQLIVRLFVAGLCLSALQYFIAVLLPSFIWSILLGFFGLLLTLFLSGFKISVPWNPLTFITAIGDYSEGSQLGNFLLFTEWLSIIFFIPILYFGFEWYKYKSLKRAFFSHNRFWPSAVILIAGAGLLAYMLHPLQYGNSKNTVIAGKIESDQKFRKGYLIDDFTGDTLTSFAVKDGKFHKVIDRKFPLEQYRLSLEADMNTAVAVVMSSKDSVFIIVKSYGNQTKPEVSGTRLAENQTELKPSTAWSYSEYMIEENNYIDKPDKVASQIKSDWQNELSDSKNFTTRDNYIPKQDYLLLSTKLSGLRYLTIWNKYADKRKVVVPSSSRDKLPPEIQEIRKTVNLKDQSLLSSPDYLDYLMHELTEKDTSDIDQNLRRLNAISRLKNDAFKDRLLFYQLKNSITAASNSAERSDLISRYGAGIKDAKLNKLAVAFYKAQEKIGKGMPAPFFEATDLAGKNTSLSDLKGKYVVVDVWATWCGPCRQQSPYFERLAIKYKKANVVFMALSIDKQKDKWFFQAKAKSKSVVQWHVGTNKKVADDYSIESIPRFLFIGPDGNFINSQMPHPSESSFEELLTQELQKAGNLGSAPNVSSDLLN